MTFPNNHILSVDQLTRTDVESAFLGAQKLESYLEKDRISRVLEGYVLCSIFWEPSTRTRLSFGSAFNRLGGSVRETVGAEASAIAKGESLHDFARVISAYCDCVVMRHPEAGAVAEFAKHSKVPVINAGDGANEHPTQAILDIYTINQELEAKKKDLKGFSLAVVGDLKYGRTVHSLLKLVSVFEDITFHLVSPESLHLPEGIIALVKDRGHRVLQFHSLEEGIQDVDVLYMTRTQSERFDSKEEAEKHQGHFRLNQAIYSRCCDPETIIMHPLPRDSRPSAQELSTDLDTNPNLAIFRQSDNGLIVRMAVFALVLDVLDF